MTVDQLIDLDVSFVDEWLETESARLADCPVKNEQFHEDWLAFGLVLFPQDQGSSLH